MSRIESVSKPKKSEIVAAKIRDYIVAHDLNPGDRLPTEGELALRFGVSRVSVREATQALGFLGILEAAPRRGLTVGQISMKRLSRYLGFHFAVGNYPVDELIETRVVVETGGLRHVAEQMKRDKSIYAHLHELNDQLRRAHGSREWIRGETRFHCALVAASGLRGLSAFNDLLQVFFQRFRKDFPPPQWGLAVDSHQQIIDGLRDGNHDLARILLIEHIESLRDRIAKESIRRNGSATRSAAASNGKKRK